MKILSLIVCLALVISSQAAGFSSGGRSSSGGSRGSSGGHSSFRPSTPSHHAPIRHTPVRTAPVHHAPVRTAPVHHTPKPAPVHHAPVRHTPVKPTPVHHTPKPTPVPHKPIHHTPVKPAPVHHAPVKPVHTPVHTPTKPVHTPPTKPVHTPVKPNPVQHTPVKPNPVQHTPVKPTPVQHTPVKTAPVKPTPTQTTPVKPAPVQHTPPSTKGGLSTAQLQKIMPGAKSAVVEKYAPHLNQAMKDAGINTPARQNAFIAQLAHESGQFRYMQELASGKAYEGRKDLGNTHPGDGEKYKGRGPIQITGRANYAAAGKALGIDLVNHPELAATPEVGFKTAAWFWNTRHLNNLADKNTADSFSSITKAVNGCANCKSTHAEERNKFWRAASEINK